MTDALTRPAWPRTGLPIEDVLDDLVTALTGAGQAVLVAPPGAGKTTLAPLALLNAPWAGGRILMLEPRRLAARGAAARMAELTGGAPGGLVGYRIRGESRVSAETRVEVVTEGVLTRMIQSDPELSGVSAVIFDEFHERSLHADLGLALTLECRAALREDLRLLVMSATLDADPIAALMGGAPVIRSEGRAFPVETRWLDAPWASGRRAPRMEAAVARLIERALDDAEGDALVFLPGAAEIDRTRRALDLGAGVDIRTLHGGLGFDEQRRALAAAGAGKRKVVLSTAIAETSLTVEGVRIVVDAGQARRARFEPGAGMSRLVTERVSRAEADQRRGRAGRLGPGTCWRLWTKGEEAGLAPFAPPEIEIADLAPLALEMAAWGADPSDMAFLTPPPSGPYAAATTLLRRLGALDAGGAITAHGRSLAAAPTHPRLAQMILTAPATARRDACDLAALLEDRDPMRGAGIDLGPRLAAMRGKGGPPALARIRAEGARLARRLRVGPARGPARAGPLIARAFPDRIARRRPGGAPRYLLAGGAGAAAPADDVLAAAPLLAVADLDGGGPDARIRLAAELTMGDLEEGFADRIAWRELCEWRRTEGRVVASRRRMLDTITLEEAPWPGAPAELVAARLADGLRDLGLDALPWSKRARRLAARAVWARARGAAIADLTPAALLDRLDDWLTPRLVGMRSLEDLRRLDLTAILKDELGWEGARLLDQIAPESFAPPVGGAAPIDYSGETPTISIRLQALFGLDQHPCVGRPPAPLLVELLSPAGRPVQTTGDLPGFWRSSYADVRKDMRGRYPKHPWPEAPQSAAPTTRAKPRGR